MSVSAGDPHSATLEEQRLAAAQAACGYTFRDAGLLLQALTHPSAAEGRTHDAGYERLEFLGDAVISLVIAAELYARFPQLREGALTKLKTGAVSGGALATAAAELGLAELLLFGEGERRDGGRGLRSALENAFEALVAAIYLDGGFTPAREFVGRTLGHHIGEHAAAPSNPKGELQELEQARGHTPEYRVVREEGPPHDRVFFAVVEIDGSVLGEGHGRSKRLAESAAAQAALDTLGSASEDEA